LVAHQCSQPRNWQDYEIRWVTQIATQVGFALDNAKLLRRLKHQGVPTQLLNSFTLGIRDRLKESELLKTSVEQARKVMGLDRVIVYQFDVNWNGTVVAESVVPGYPRALRSQIKDPCFARDYAEKYRQGHVCAIANIQQANLTECYLEQLEFFAVKANLVAPILQDERLFGLLIGHQCSQPRSWEQWEIDLFVQLALQLEFALDRARLQAELTQARHRSYVADEQLEQQSHQHPDHLGTIGQQKNIQLKKSMATLQETIAEVTKRVKHLNQSHQNLYQMVSLVNEMKEQMNQQRSQALIVNEQTNEADQSSIIAIAKIVNPLSEKLARETVQVESLLGEIALKANEVADAVVIGETQDERKTHLTFEPIKNPNSEVKAIAGQVVRGTEPSQSLTLMNQFVEEIAKLSEQISQQSIAVTVSFQKLAAFAQELSSAREESSINRD
jgi:GAF domain-containing protein